MQIHKKKILSLILILLALLGAASLAPAGEIHEAASFVHRGRDLLLDERSHVLLQQRCRHLLVLDRVDGHRR